MPFKKKPPKPAPQGPRELCPLCKGKGKAIDGFTCPLCDGEGTVPAGEAK